MLKMMRNSQNMLNILHTQFYMLKRSSCVPSVASVSQARRAQGVQEVQGVLCKQNVSQARRAQDVSFWASIKFMEPLFYCLVLLVLPVLPELPEQAELAKD